MRQSMKKWPVAIFLIAFVSELFAIRWRWQRAQLHTLRDWYEDSFRTYLLESIAPWLVAFNVLTAVWLLIIRIREKHDKV